MAYIVYVLQSERNGRYYTGQTTDVARRLAEHNAGKSPYDKINKPFKVVYSESASSRVEAVRLERYYKTGYGRQKLAILMNNMGH